MWYVLQAAIWAGIMWTNYVGHWSDNWFAASALGIMMAWGITQAVQMLMNFTVRLTVLLQSLWQGRDSFPRDY